MPFSYERARRELLHEQEELQEQLKHLRATEYESTGHSSHMAEDATEAFEQTVGIALRRKVERSLERSTRALAKLDDGVYGICEACGARIDRARLKALPSVAFCMDCQTRREFKRTRAGSR
jgi:RNA polymerase-binding transcription factor DksA